MTVPFITYIFGVPGAEGLFEQTLFEACNLNPTAVGMRRYHQYLSLCIEQDPAKQKEVHRRLCRGWHIDTPEGKKAILKDISKGLIGAELQDLARSFGDDGGGILLQRGLSCLKKEEGELLSDLSQQQATILH